MSVIARMVAADCPDLWRGAVRAQNFQTAGRALPSKTSNDFSREKIQSLHVVVSSVPNQHGAEDMSQAIGNAARKSGDPRDDARTSLKHAFRQHVTEPPKVVAKKVGASPDSVESYRQGNIPQSWAQMIAFCRAYPGFGLEALELMGIDIDRDRDAYAMFLALQQRVRET